MTLSPQFDQGDALLTLTLSIAAYVDETPLPGESIAQQEARMLRDINASLAASAYPTWSVAWGPKLNADRSNMMYIAGSPSTGQYAVAIRGTDWWFLLDWLEDLASVLPLVPYPYLSGAGAMVAEGTSIGIQQLIQMGPAAFLKNVPDGATIFVTGHSLGGCLASAIAPYLALELGGPGALRVYTFAAPSAGDVAFASAYNALFEPTGGLPSAFRFFNTLDVVPNGWASLPTIETYYEPFPACTQDIKDLVNFAQGQVGNEYVQVGSASNGTAIALPGHLIFFSGLATQAINPIGDALFLYEVAQQHLGSTYQALLQAPHVPAAQAKLRGFLASREPAAPARNAGRTCQSRGPTPTQSQGGPTMTGTVPDYFQDEGDAALRCRVEWLTREVGVQDAFFSKHLRVNETAFRRWRNDSVPLPPGSEGDLRALWRTVQHLFSFLNFDSQRVKTLLEYCVPGVSRGTAAGLIPPWSGWSLICYLEEHGPRALPEVDRWVTTLRFGDPYAGTPLQTSTRQTAHSS